jgi:hypothetical protein
MVIGLEVSNVHVQTAQDFEIATVIFEPLAFKLEIVNVSVNTVPGWTNACVFGDTQRALIVTEIVALRIEKPVALTVIVPDPPFDTAVHETETLADLPVGTLTELGLAVHDWAMPPSVIVIVNWSSSGVLFVIV